jgi:predicted small metal-binding protein
MADQKLKKASCDPECGFMVQSHDDQEIMSMMKSHAQDKHQMDMTDEDVVARMQDVN